jgi:diaminopimelate decarboxylase
MNKPIPNENIITGLLYRHPSPFYLYDVGGILRRHKEIANAFSWNSGFRQYFAMKALPNPAIVKALYEIGSGVDCSSLTELEICSLLGFRGNSLFFTSNNTTDIEFQKALAMDAVINLDTPSLISRFSKFASTEELVAFRLNPGANMPGNVIIGKPLESKFGCTVEQVLEGLNTLSLKGFKRFGLHAMVVSNELQLSSLVSTAELLFELAIRIKKEVNISLEIINLGGGIGIPYKPEDCEVDIAHYGKSVKELFDNLLVPEGLENIKIATENGRAITGPFGFLVTRVTNVKKSYKQYIGVDACMANLMRPGMYNAYHHITVLGKDPSEYIYESDVVGSLCENNDKFAINRRMPIVEEGDIIVIHDAGAHSHSMGFQYNGRLRSAEFLFDSSGVTKMIRRAETFDDYISTVVW